MMYLLLSLAYATELTTALGPSSICSRGLNGLLQPLTTHAPAQSFCSKKHPISAVTVTFCAFTLWYNMIASGNVVRG
jgi:hypothetical protein